MFRRNMLPPSSRWIQSLWRRRPYVFTQSCSAPFRKTVVAIVTSATKRAGKFVDMQASHEGTWRSGDGVPLILNLNIKWGEWSGSCIGHFTLRVRWPGTHWTERWVGPTAGLDDLPSIGLFSLCPAPDSHCKYWAIPDPSHSYDNWSKFWRKQNNWN